MVVLKKDLISSVEVEVLPDDEYALWEQAVTDAEQQYSERRRSGQLENLPNQQPAAQERASASGNVAVASALESALLPDLEDFGLKINRRAKHRPRGLRVTDITGAEWCQQQLAFALSARLPKVIFCCSTLHCHFSVTIMSKPANATTGGYRDRVNGSWHSCTCSFGG